MLPARTGTILKSIVGQYIAKAIPVPSQSIAHKFGLEISPATVRNEMAHLEQEGYISAPIHQPEAYLQIKATATMWSH